MLSIGPARTGQRDTGMNRQQRRAQARRLQISKEVELKHKAELIDRQNRVYDATLLLNMACMGLTLADMGYGDTIIEKAITGYNKRVSSVDGETVTLDTLLKELEDRRGITFRWMD